jgi:RNAse (barnase) inhibitor barstar
LLVSVPAGLEIIPSKRKKRDFDDRRDFKRIRSLDPETVARLDKLRADLQESIERTVRIEQAFVKQLRKEALNSNRIKHIIQVVEEIPFHSDLQRKICDARITEILKSKAKAEQERRAEALKKKEESKKEACTCLACLEYN